MSPTTGTKKAPQSKAINVKDLDVNLMGVDREVKAARLAIAAGEHLLLLGPPGTAKSLLADQVFANFEGSVFKTQLSKNTDETILFGMPDMKKLREDGEVHYRANASHTIFNAEWAFIDEMFDASDVLLRSLLGILNEREFVRANQTIPCQLLSCIATSNYARLNEITAAVVDRFAIAVGMNDLSKQERQVLYNFSPGTDFEGYKPTVKIPLKTLGSVRGMVPDIILHDIYRNAMMKSARELDFSPRRERRAALLVRVSAILNERAEVTTDDVLSVLPLMVPVLADRQAYYDLVMKTRKGLQDALATAKIERDQLKKIEDVTDLGDTTLSARAQLASERLVMLADMEAATEIVATQIGNAERVLRAEYDKALEELGLGAPVDDAERIAHLTEADDDEEYDELRQELAEEDEEDV